LKLLRSLLPAIDRWQRNNRLVASSYGVVKKFGDDRANQYVVALGWYGFVAIYPLLLVVISVFGFIGLYAMRRWWRPLIRTVDRVFHVTPEWSNNLSR
jgi:uncharacterized BrkB/YihY/UPF0761 family membrane protein